MQKQIDIDYMKIIEHLLKRCCMTAFALKPLRDKDGFGFMYQIFALDDGKKCYKLYSIKPCDGKNIPPWPCVMKSPIEIDAFYMHSSLGLVSIFPCSFLCSNGLECELSKDLCTAFANYAVDGSLEFYDANGYWKTSFIEKGTTVEQLAIEYELADSNN